VLWWDGTHERSRDMTELTLHSHTASDGYVWRYRHYAAASPPSARVIYLHGIQSHGGWYVDSCGQIADAGYDVSFLERRGSGLNDRARGDAPSFRRLLDDVAEFITPLPGPRFLMGISWGGKLAVGFQRRHPGQCDGLILIAPGLSPRVRPPLGERLRIVAARFLTPRRPFAIPLNEPELFTANPVRQRYIRDDSLGLRAATARMLFESGRIDVYLRFAARHVAVPVLLLLAEHDRIIGNTATRRFVERFPTTDRTIIEYAGKHHTLEFEPGGPPFVNDVLKWLERRVRDRQAEPDLQSPGAAL
jgi:alpha-beta hydrolase superfamily lysophospholipase